MVLFCYLCLNYGVDLYNVDKSVETGDSPTENYIVLISLTDSLMEHELDDLPKVACRTCVQSLLQQHWFNVQSVKAKNVVLGKGGWLNTDELDEFCSVRTMLNEKRAISEAELLSPSNIVSDPDLAIEDSTEIAEIVVETKDQQLELAATTEQELEVPAESPKTTRQRPSRRGKPKTNRKKKRLEIADIIEEAIDDEDESEPKGASNLIPRQVYTPEEIERRPFACPICGGRFVRRDYLVVHMRRHRGEKPYQCKFCDKAFPRPTDLTVHERYHTNKKSHFCQLCSKGFNRAYNLKVHLRVHTKERPYKCSECEKCYGQSNDLKTHIRTKHSGERWECEFCVETFIQRHQLTRHMNKVHNVEITSHNARLEKIDLNLSPINDD